MNVFIAHSSRDAEAAFALGELMIECTDIMPGDILRWSNFADPAEAREAMINSDAVAALVPAERYAFGELVFELGAAWAADRLIFLFFMHGVDFRDLPEVIAHYPGAHMAAPDAPMMLVSTLHEMAEFLGIEAKRRASPLDAIDRLISLSRSSIEPVKQSAETDVEDLGFHFDAIATDRCEVLCEHESTVMGATTRGQTLIRTTWDELFRSFAAFLEHPQDEEYLVRLIIEFCKSKDATFEQNCRYGIFKRPTVEGGSFDAIIKHFEQEGFIAHARPPHSAFQQKRETRRYWQTTPSGSEHLRDILVQQKTLQQWYGKEKHVQRGAVLRVDEKR